MASRIDYSQNRKLYVGTTSELSVADGGVVVDNQLILGGTSSSYMLDVLSSASIGSRNVGTNTTNFENKLVVAGKNNYSDGTTWYGDYGQILLSSTSNMTGSARQFLITNALDNNKFAIIRSVDATTNPVTNSTGTGVNSGTADLVIDNTGNVGIGATAPLRKLHVAGGQGFAVNASTSQYYGVYIPALGEGADPQIQIGDWHNAGATLMWDSSARSLNLDTQYSTGAGTFKITGNDGASTFLNISTIGNVGIGDTTNNAKLGINGGAVKIKNIVSSSPDSQLRRNINIASFAKGGATGTGKLVIETPAMTQGAMGKFKISGWQYDESWDLTVSGYLRIGTGRGWQQIGGAILTGNPPFDVDEVRLCYNSTTNIFYIILGTNTTFWDYYTSVIIDADSIYLDTIPTTGWDMEITTSDPSGLTSDITLTDIAEYGSSNAIIPGSVAIGSYSTNGRLNVTDGDAEMIFGSASSARPWLRLKHNIAPVDGEEVGLQDFNAFNDADQDTRYAIWTAKAEDVTDGSEDGSLTLMTMENGTLTNTLTGRSGNVGIGTTSPSAKLEVAFDGSHTSGDISYTQANIDVYNPLQANTDEKGSIITFTDNYFDGTNYHKTTRAAIKGGTDTVGNTANGFLAFYTDSGGANSASERMRITSGGNVGIGTDNPSRKLDVRGDAQILSTGATGLRIVGGTTDEVYMIFGDADDNSMGGFGYDNNTNELSIDVNNSEAIRIDSLGNVGIGTTSPNNKLDVKISTANRTTLEPVMSVSAEGSGPYTGFGPKISFSSNIYYGAATGNPAGIIETAYIGAVMGVTYATNSDLVFATRDGATSVTEKMRILGNGNVGIGTTGPIGKLEVRSSVVRTSVNGGADELVLQNAGYSGMTILSSNTTAAQIHFGDDAMTNTGMIQYWNNTNSMTFSTNGGSERMRITAAGNIGVNTTSPSYKLSVNGTIQSDLIRGYTYPDHSFLDFDYDQTAASNTTSLVSIGRVSYISDSNGNDPATSIGHSFMTGTTDIDTATPLLTILNNGKVGIGTTSPISKFTVTGTDNTNQANIGHSTQSVFIKVNGTNVDYNSSGNSGGSHTFSTGNVERMRIEVGGNVGIGTTAPTTKLNVSGSIAVSSGSYLSFIDSNLNYNKIGRNTSVGGIQITTGGNATMNLLDNGNVGIGTTSPTQKLHVNGNLRITGAYYDSNNSPGTANQVLVSTVTGTDWIDGSAIPGVPAGSGTLNTVAMWTPDGDTLGDSPITISGNNATFAGTVQATSYKIGGVTVLQGTSTVTVGSGGGTGKVQLNTTSGVGLILDGSNVGIGTTSPITKVHVFEAGTAMIRVDSGATSPYKAGIEFLRSSINGGRIYNDGGAVQVKLESDFAYDAANPTRGGFMFKTAPVTSATLVDAVRIDARGYVGIGTTSPEEKLKVIGSVLISNNEFYKVENTTGTNYKIAGLTNGNMIQIGAIDYTSAGTIFAGGDNVSITTGGASGSTRIKIASSGNVGIGTTSPNHKLDIYSNENVPLRIHRPNNANLNSDGAWGIGFSTRGDAVTSTTDTRSGIFSYYNGNLFLATNNTRIDQDPFDYARLTILSGGNVGIGTTSPSVQLDIEDSSNVIVDMNTTTANANTTIRLQESGSVKATIGYDGTNDGLILTTGGFTAGNGIFIDDSQNVGIGTASPDRKLHVNSGSTNIVATFESTDATAAISLQDNSTTNDSKVQIRAIGDDFNIVAGGSQRVTVNSSGNVGIGTTSPGSPLSVVGSYSSSDEIVEIGGGTGINTDFKLKIGAVDQDYIWFQSVKPGDNYYDLVFNPTAGNVGIGTTSPNAKLVVKGGGLVSQDFFHIEDSGGIRMLEVTSDGAGNSNLQVKDTAGATKSLINSAGNSYFNGGNVGIGTTSPGAKLHISEDSAAQLYLERTGSITGKYRLGIAGANNRFYISDIAQSADRFVINENGNVGIGTDSPTQKLHVAGNARVTGAYYDSNNSPGTANQVLVSTVTGTDWIDGSAIPGVPAGSGTGNYLARWTPNGDTLGIGVVYDNGTNVGIGIDDPAARLEVKQNLYVSHQNAEEITFRLDNYGTTGTDAGPLLRMFNQSGTTVVNIDSRSGSSRDTYFNQGGNFGIGVTGPQTKLQVNGDISVTSGDAYRMFNAAGTGWGEMSLNEADNIVSFNRGIENTGNDWKLSENSADSFVCATQGDFGIGTTGPSEKLDVAGNIKIQSALLSNQENTDVDTGTETVASVAIATYTAAFFDFVIKKTTNVRSGTVYACHDGTNVEFTETSTQDLGDTSDVTLSVDISGGNMRLRATTTSDDWSVKSLIRAI